MELEQIRLRKFLVKLDDVIMDNCYYDDEKQTEVFEVTEADVYECMMETDEFHFLGTEKVKQYIHIFMTDWKSASAIRHAFNIF